MSNEGEGVSGVLRIWLYSAVQTHALTRPPDLGLAGTVSTKLGNLRIYLQVIFLIKKMVFIRCLRA